MKIYEAPSMELVKVTAVETVANGDDLKSVHYDQLVD